MNALSINDRYDPDAVERWRLDDLSASDLSDDDDNEMTAVLKDWKRKGKLTSVTTGATLRTLYQRHRLCMLMTAVLLVVFLPLIVVGSRMRDWVWVKHSKEWVSVYLTVGECMLTLQESPPWYPSPRGGTSERWEYSYLKAQALVERMSLVEKVNVTTGVGWQMGLCVGNTGT